tara:strand:- start:10 stop:798 length:789 start_codon:yes stop_codon:yes gene_type:complete
MSKIALLESIALAYSKKLGLDYITNEARAYAAEKLGIDKQQGNPKYAISLGGQTFDPINMLKNAGLNKGIKGIFGGSSNILGPLAIGAGLMYLGNKTNPLNKNSYNYNPNLRGELDYAGGAGLLSRSPTHGGLVYSGDSVLSGRNAVHGGKNVGYSRDLGSYISKQQAIKDRGFHKFTNIPFSDVLDKRLDRAKKELEDMTTYEFDQIDADRAKAQNRKTYQAPYQGQVHGKGNGNSGNTPASGFSDDTPGTPFRRGGIASL